MSQNAERRTANGRKHWSLRRSAIISHILHTIKYVSWTYLNVFIFDKLYRYDLLYASLFLSLFFPLALLLMGLLFIQYIIYDIHMLDLLKCTSYCIVSIFAFYSYCLWSLKRSLFFRFWLLSVLFFSGFPLFFSVLKRKWVQELFIELKSFFLILLLVNIAERTFL